MKLSKKINGVLNKAYDKTKKVASKIVKPVKKYAPAVMIAMSSVGSVKAAPNANPVDKKVDAKMITVKSRANSGKFLFNNMRFDVKTMHVEDINTLFISGNNSAAMYGGKTMETVKDFGPMLNKISDLQKVIAANPEKYADLNEVIAKHGIRSDAFKEAMKNYNDEAKRRELTGDIIDYLWVSHYQPVFDANAKIGYPKVTFENKNNPETFGYVASVISCMGQSSRQTPEIYKEAMERAKTQLGDKALLDDCIDISYDIRHERWGLDKRYFGSDGKSGEKYLNKKIREKIASLMSNELGYKTLSFDEARLNSEKEMVVATDAIKVPASDSLETVERYDIKKGKNKTDKKPMLRDALLRNDELSLPNLKPEDLGVILQGLDLTLEQPDLLLEERAKEVEEIEKLNKRIEEISTDDFFFYGKKMIVDYEEMSKKQENIVD